jgi:hypothetical protein
MSLINGQPMFPLRNVSQNISTGYYMDRNGGVWSTRGSKDGAQAVQLKGSRSNSGTYFKFGQQWGSGWRHDTLKQMAMTHKDWAKETAEFGAKAAELKAVLAKTPTSTRAYAETVLDGIAQRGSVIGRVHKGKLVFGSEPKIHLTAQSVRDEMLRLATTYPGTKFVRLVVDSAVVSGGLEWL